MVNPDSRSFRRARERAEPSIDDDPVRTYIQARTDLDEAVKQVAETIATIMDGARLLRNWRSVYVSDEGIPFPIDIMEGDDVLSGKEWPDAHSIATILSRYHLARTTVNSAWRVVPAQDRASLQPPYS